MKLQVLYCFMFCVQLFQEDTVNVNVLNNVCIYFLLCVLVEFLYDNYWKCAVIYHLSVSGNASAEANTNR